MRKFKITEEQFKEIVNEIQTADSGATVSVSADNSGNVSPEAVKQGVDMAKKTGSDSMKVTGLSNSTTATPVYESKLISKQQIKEMRLKKLKENSVVVPVSNLFK